MTNLYEDSCPITDISKLINWVHLKSLHIPNNLIKTCNPLGYLKELTGLIKRAQQSVKLLDYYSIG